MGPVIIGENGSTGGRNDIKIASRNWDANANPDHDFGIELRGSHIDSQMTLRAGACLGDGIRFAPDTDGPSYLNECNLWLSATSNDGVGIVVFWGNRR